MRICVASTVRYPTDRAYGIALSHTIDSMLSLGHSVTACSPNLSPQAAQSEENLEPRYQIHNFSDLWWRLLHRLGSRSNFGIFTHLNRLRSVFKFRRFLNYNSFDLIWTRDVLLASASLSYPSRVILEEHHIPSVRQANRYRRLIVNADDRVHFVAISPPVFAALRGLGVPPSHLTLEISGVTKDFFHLPRTGPTVERELHLAYFGSGNFLGSDKGLFDLLRNLEYASESLLLKLHLVGPSDRDWNTLRKTCVDEGLSIRNVIPEHRIPHHLVSSRIQQMDILVFPSPDSPQLSPTSPLKLLEYAASGKPILGANSQSLRNVLAADQFIGYEFGCPESFLNGIRKICGEPDKLREICDNAFEFALGHEWSQRTQRILSLLD